MDPENMKRPKYPRDATIDLLRQQIFSPNKGKFAIRILTARAESQGDRPVQSNQELPLNAKRQRLSTKKFRGMGTT
jgi:hypothetical protein